MFSGHKKDEDLHLKWRCPYLRGNSEFVSGVKTCTFNGRSYYRRLPSAEGHNSEELFIELALRFVNVKILHLSKHIITEEERKKKYLLKAGISSSTKASQKDIVKITDYDDSTLNYFKSRHHEAKERKYELEADLRKLSDSQMSAKRTEKKNGQVRKIIRNVRQMKPSTVKPKLNRLYRWVKGEESDSNDMETRDCRPGNRRVRRSLNRIGGKKSKGLVKSNSKEGEIGSLDLPKFVLTPPDEHDDTGSLDSLSLRRCPSSRSNISR